MHKLIENNLAAIEQSKERVILMEEDILLAERLAPDKRVWIDNDVNISWSAKSMNEVKQLLRAFAQEGYLLDRINDKLAPTMWVIKGINNEICLLPSWSTEEGTMCRLVKIDEKIQTIPVYKLVCDKEGK